MPRPCRVLALRTSKIGLTQWQMHVWVKAPQESSHGEPTVFQQHCIIAVGCLEFPLALTVMPKLILDFLVVCVETYIIDTRRNWGSIASVVKGAKICISDTISVVTVPRHGAFRSSYEAERTLRLRSLSQRTLVR